MSKRIRKKKATLNRAAGPIIGNGLMYVAPGQQQGTMGQVFYGNSLKNIPVGQSALFSPGVPLAPQPGINVGGYPIQWRFPIASNTFPVDRTNQNPDIPSFQQLRNLAKLYSGITLCERAWADLVPRMKLKIDLKQAYIDAGADSKDYQTEIAYFSSWFESPDKMHDLHSWIRMSLREQTQVDELYIYKRKKRGGGLYALELVAGDQMKPLLDDWGKIPQPPSFAYQQYPWGIPGAWFRSDEMIHYQESPAADNPYGQSRVERIIMLVNQALRKQKKDLSHFTEGNIPQGMMKVPADATWTPDQIDAFEQAWNALLAGNASQQVRMRFTQPGMEYQAFEQYQLDPTFDKFLLNVSVAAYGLSMQDVAFTDDVNRSTGVSQEDMTYRRTIEPLAHVYAGFITSCINNDFDPDLHGEMFEASFVGYEEETDVSELAGAYSTLVTSGILGVTNAGKLLKLPDDPNAPYIGRILMTQTGPIFLDDMASDKMRNAQMQSQLATFASAGQPKPAPGQQQKQQKQSGQQDEEDDTKSAQDNTEQDESEAEQQRQIKASDLYSLDDSIDEDVEMPDDESEDEEEDPESEQEDAEWEEEIAQLLKADESEPFTVLERHTPGGHDHDQKTHGDGSHPAYGAKHDTSPQARQAMQAAAQLQPKIDAAEAKVQAAELAVIKASPADKPAARAALAKARQDAAALKAQARQEAQAERQKAQQEAQEARAKLQAEKAKAKAKAQKLAAQKKSAAAKLAAQKAKAHLQKQAAAAKAKAARMAATAQKKAQAAATKAAKASAKSATSQQHAALKAAKVQQAAAKKLQTLVNTIGTKAQLYNALSGRKLSKTWSAQDSVAAQAIASDLHSLMTMVNSHTNEENAAALVENLTSSIGRLQGQRGMTQARADVLEKLIQQSRSQMPRSVLADDEDFDESEYFGEEGEEEWTDEIDRQEPDEEKRYTISELLQLLSQQAKTQEANQANGTHLERSEKDGVAETTDHSAQIAALRDRGVQSLTWKSNCTCDVCQQNNGVTRMLGVAFPSNHVLPPCHEGCDCGAEYHYGQGEADERAVSAEYRKWRTRAIDDVKAGRVQRGFTTTLIPGTVHKWISDELVECMTPDQVRDVFNRARGLDAEPTIAGKNDLAKSVNAVFEQVARRGHEKAATMES